MTQELNSSNVFVLYHANCTDGTGAKYAAWKKYGDDGANYIAVNYGQEPPEALNQDSEVYIVDFSYPRNVLEALQKRCKSVVVLDHHKTAEEALRGLKGCHLDMSKSGAVLAWEYFHPGTKVPAILDYVQDRDLWQWKYPMTKEVLMGLSLEEKDMAAWEDALTPAGITRFYDAGEVLVKRNDIQLKSKINHVARANFSIDGSYVEVGVVNSTELPSELGNNICVDEDLKVDFAIVYSITKYAEVLLSLRSVGDFDVSNIAKALGGGGHKNASGAKIPLSMLPSLLCGNVGVHFDGEDNTWKVDE